MRKKILLSGYFGFNNLGDEAILYSMVEGLKRLGDFEIVALSADPVGTSKKFNIRSVDRMKPAAVLSELKRCDLFISGGGSLFQDITSKKSIWYYMALIWLAKKIYRKKVMIYSQGIGPVNDPSNRKRLARLLEHTDIINVRDEDSRRALADMGLHKEVFVTADTVFTLEKPDKALGKRLLAEAGIACDRPLVGIAIRPWKDSDERIVDALQKVVAHFSDQEAELILLPFYQPGDLVISQKVADLAGARAEAHILKDRLDERQMLSVIANTDVMLSMRLHGLIFGVIGEAYPIAISYDPKVDSLMKELGMPAPATVDNLSAEELIERLEDALSHLSERRRQTREAAERMRAEANEGLALIGTLLE